MTDDPSKPRPRMVIVGGSASASLATIAALEGAALTIFGQSGGQVIDTLARESNREWFGSLDLVKADDWSGSDIGRYIDEAYAGSDGLLTRKPEPKPLPPSTMTRQQRRYLARKGRTND